MLKKLSDRFESRVCCWSRQFYARARVICRKTTMLVLLSTTTTTKRTKIGVSRFNGGHCQSGLVVDASDRQWSVVNSVVTLVTDSDIVHLAKVGHPHARLLQLDVGHRQNDSDVVWVIETLMPKRKEKKNINQFGLISLRCFALFHGKLECSEATSKSNWKLNGLLIKKLDIVN